MRVFLPQKGAFWHFGSAKKRLRKFRRRLEYHILDVVLGYRWREARCCFVLGTGRCGTTTLAQVLAFSSGIRSHHEPAPTLLAERQEAYWHVREKPLKFVQVLRQGRKEAMLRARLARKLYAETSAHMTFFAPVIAEVMPNARFIYLHRHPGEVVRSGMRRGWYANHPEDCFRIYPDEADPFCMDWQTWNAFEKCCWYWQAYNRFALEFREHTGAGRVLTVPANDLFERQSGIHRKIFEFLEVDASPAEAAKRSLERPSNEQHSGDFPHFEDWDSTMKQTLDRIAGPVMRDLGYKCELGALATQWRRCRPVE